MASIGITKTQIDDSALSKSLIARRSCTEQGVRTDDSDLTLGSIRMTSGGGGYTMAGCEATAKDEIKARGAFGCTFAQEVKDKGDR